MDDLALALLSWIASRTDYDTAQMPLPQIIQMTRDELTEEFFEGSPHGDLRKDWVRTQLSALYAATDGPHGTIYVLQAARVYDAEHWDDPTENPYFREILLHELVHHAQWRSGAPDTWSCALDGEREAFRLGGLYLQERKVRDPMGNRGYWASPFTAC